MTSLLFVLLSAAPAGPRLEVPVATRFAELALACVHREYPNKLSHVLNDARDVKSPRALTPSFYGCFDWHSSVHGHWLLARLARLFPTAPFAAHARRALGRTLSVKNLAAELTYFQGAGRVSFERPYGLAWLLQLATELREWDDPEAKRWSLALAPLEQAVVERLRVWLPKLTKPIRIGEHEQTAFALGLMLDWARAAHDATFEALLIERIVTWYGADRDCPLSWEPSGQDFLSPCLAEADLMRRVKSPEGYAPWLRAFLPRLGEKAWLEPAVVSDRSDPKLAHLDGLNLSRAWMLEGVLVGLPETDELKAALTAIALAHRKAGLEAVTGEHYEGAHWLASFAVYLTSRRGLPMP